MDITIGQQTLLSMLRQYGSHCMAYSTLQEGLEYEVIEGVGFIAYLSFKHFFWSRKSVKIVLADPVCDIQNYHQMIGRFIDKYEHVIFIQGSDELAKVLDDLGYEVNQFGIETELPVQDFDLRGKHRSKLRQWRNKCQREGVTVKETNFGSDGVSPDKVKALSNSWMKRKGGHEFVFLTRPLCYEVEPDVRCFLAYQDTSLIAFSVFDPIYANGDVIGYYHNIDRVSEAAPHGTGAYVILEAMELFRKEGIELISLGMSPLYQIKRTEYRYNNFLHDALFFAFKNMEFLYPFKGNASHKKKFYGTRKRVFFSSTKGNSLWQLLIALKATKLF